MPDLSAVGAQLKKAGDELGSRLSAMRSELEGAWHQGTGTALREVDHWATTAVRTVVEAVVSRVDLTALVREHVDIEAIIQDLDLVGVAQQVIDEVDLPGTIRRSSSSLTSTAIRGVRLQGMAADESLTRMVDHLLPGRHRHNGARQSSPAAADRPEVTARPD